MNHIQFAGNPAYRPAYPTPVPEGYAGTVFYEPTADTSYHNRRYIAAQAHAIYAACGLTRDLQMKILDEMLTAVNTNKLSDVAVLVNNLRYRCQYPLDEHAAIRLGLIFYFVEGEDPEQATTHWMEHKLRLVEEDPAARDFFMMRGVENLPLYTELLKGASQSYFPERESHLQGLTPQP